MGEHVPPLICWHSSSGALTLNLALRVPEAWTAFLSFRGFGFPLSLRDRKPRSPRECTPCNSCLVQYLYPKGTSRSLSPEFQSVVLSWNPLQNFPPFNNPRSYTRCYSIMGLSCHLFGNLEPLNKENWEEGQPGTQNEFFLCPLLK